MLVTITLWKVRSLRILGSLLKGLVSKTGKDRDMKLNMLSLHTSKHLHMLQNTPHLRLCIVQISKTDF